VLALQEDAGLMSPVLWGDAVRPQQPGWTGGLGNVIPAERASCGSEGRGGNEVRGWGQE